MEERAPEPRPEPRAEAPAPAVPRAAPAASHPFAAAAAGAFGLALLAAVALGPDFLKQRRGAAPESSPEPPRPALSAPDPVPAAPSGGSSLDFIAKEPAAEEDGGAMMELLTDLPPEPAAALAAPVTAAPPPVRLKSLLKPGGSGVRSWFRPDAEPTKTAAFVDNAPVPAPRGKAAPDREGDRARELVSGMQKTLEREASRASGRERARSRSSASSTQPGTGAQTGQRGTGYQSAPAAPPTTASPPRRAAAACGKGGLKVPGYAACCRPGYWFNTVANTCCPREELCRAKGVGSCVQINQAECTLFDPNNGACL